MNINGWHITASDDGQYLYIELDGSPGQIHIKADDEGFTVDIWSDGQDDCFVAGTWAAYTELEPD